MQFIKQKLDSAKWFIDAIKQRQRKLYCYYECHYALSKEYFFRRRRNQTSSNDSKDIADMVGLDISTVSRVANSKYVDTPYGQN